jgi:beta-galactosidase
MTPWRMMRAGLALAIPVLGWPGPATATPDGARVSAGVQELSLDGDWELGPGRVYTRTVHVPGLATDPKKINEVPLWYRRTVRLPRGSWTHATLVLNGARFCPAVYIDGTRVSERPGGMTVTTHPLASPAVVPGAEITLEIALRPLSAVDPQDASRVPEADLWRTNVSSGLWDSVRLRLHGSTRLARILPWYDIANDTLDVRWELDRLRPAASAETLRFRVLDQERRPVAEASAAAQGSKGKTTIPLQGACRLWSPQTPVLYTLEATLESDEALSDRRRVTVGMRDFRVEGLGFLLNGKPIRLRAGTVVWPRFVRDPEGSDLAWDTAWFEKNIVARLKTHGANTLRFHLGVPPEALLDLCDRLGLMVQAEWHFFHGVAASRESMVAQWRDWLDLCMRHPSTGVIHAWNETGEGELEAAWAALEELLPEYPPLVIGHRDVRHIHKYWWSLFENVGLYYDSAEQFGTAIMVDEFGGNYLDGNGDEGGYPTVKESFLRFLGRGHTRAMRTRLHTEANGKIAEYWRRLGAAGYSPFCLLGSPEDGNHWFWGSLKDGRPKPVWDACTAAWSPRAVSLEIWDRNFEPGQEVTLLAYFINDTGEDAALEARVAVRPEAPVEIPAELVRADPATGSGPRATPAGRSSSRAVPEQTLTASVKAYGVEQRPVTVVLPREAGRWQIEGVLARPPAGVTHPVVSAWRFRTMTVAVPARLEGATVAVPEGEEELRALLARSGLRAVAVDDPGAQVVATARETWRRITAGEGPMAALEKALVAGRSIVMLDLGPTPLGQGYGKDLGPLQGAPKPRPSPPVTLDLLGVPLSFREVAEPESHLQPATDDRSLWGGMDTDATWMWNGLRGGLVAPASAMEILQADPDGVVALWQERGADPGLLKGEAYYAYELQGHYAFSTSKDDSAAKQRLRERVRFLVEDAPSLVISLDPEAPIRVVDLAAEYRQSGAGPPLTVQPLATCGKNLTRTPIVRVRFADGRGGLILSQLLTAGRLAPGFGQPGLYGLRYDPAAAQLVLNMLAAGMGDPVSTSDPRAP